MDPITTLMDEHVVILSMCDAAAREAARLRSGGAFDATRIDGMLDFIRSFADRCHHLKEEDLLFARMAERGFPVDSGPIGVMRHEHDVGRGHVRAIAEAAPRAAAGQAAGVKAVADNLIGWAELLRAHIYKEDNVLYPMARRALAAADLDDLESEFARVDGEAAGGGAAEAHRAFVRDLLMQLG
jgi:hemerythrin-like domain-containing protein